MENPDELTQSPSNSNAVRDPSTLEVLSSSMGDENKTILTGSLYMNGRKPVQKSGGLAQSPSASGSKVRASTELRINVRRSATTAPARKMGAVAPPKVQTRAEGNATLPGGGQIMTALLPTGMQPRSNFAPLDGVSVERVEASGNTPSSLPLRSTVLMAGSVGDATTSASFLVSPGKKNNVSTGIAPKIAVGAKQEDAGGEIEDLDDGRDLEKVLSRLTKSADNTEFVYLRPYLPDAQAPVSQRLTPINPYHIEVVPHSKVNQDNYLTMSAFGVTHLIDGQPEFTPLDRWQEERAIFLHILQINVFKKFRVWKPLLIWKNVVHYGKMHKNQGLLVKHLFWTDNIARRAILDVRTACMDLSHSTLHSFTPGYLYRLDEFNQLQAAQRSRVSREIDEVWNAQVDCLEAACRLTLEQLEAKLFGGGAQDGNTATAPGLPASELHKYQYTVKASKRVQHERLYHLLRVCDYVVFSTLHQMVNGTLRSLLHHLSASSTPATLLPSGGVAPSTTVARSQEVSDVQPETQPAAAVADDAAAVTGDAANAPAAPVADVSAQATSVAQSATAATVTDDARETNQKVDGQKPAPAIFEVEVILEGDDFVFKPTQRDFEEQIQHLVDKSLEAVSSPTRLLGNERLAEYTVLFEADTDVATESLASVSDTLLNDDEFKDMREKLREALEAAFAVAEACKQSYEPFRLMAIASRAVNPDDLKHKFEEGGMGLDDFKAQLVQLRAQVFAAFDVRMHCLRTRTNARKR